MRIPALVSTLLLTGACATAPVVVAPVKPTTIAWEQKLGWMMRLEDQRILRDAAAANPDAAVVTPAAAPGAVAPLLPPSDLVRLLRDPEGRVRRRAALAAGRVGLAEAVEPLISLLTDEEWEVRQMAAFALGLIGAPSARPALTSALTDVHPVVQGRAAEALAAIGDKADAPAIAAMVKGHLQAGALAAVAVDGVSMTLPPPADAVRLGLSALARLGAFESLAQVALDADGKPVSRWWPVAAALQRVGDARAAPALLELLAAGGRYAPAFAARGLGALKAASAVPALMQMVDAKNAPGPVVVQALRALVEIADPRSGAQMLALASNGQADLALRLEALRGLAAIRPANASDPLIDLLTSREPLIRAGALTALARLDADTFLATLSGLDPDADWRVRAALASALATFDPQQGLSLLQRLASDPEPRVVTAALSALVTARAPEASALLVARLGADDLGVRLAAATGLGTLKAMTAVPQLVDAVRRWKSEAAYAPRAAALGALAAIDATAARPLLQEGLTDRDWAVRVRAAELLKSAGVTEGVEAAMRPAPSGRTVTDAEWKWLLAPPFSPHAFIETARGTIELELTVLDAPQTVASFMALARRGFYNGLPVHRVVADFVMQAGDPRGDGEGGPGYTLRDEINQRPYLRGTVGMALDWRDTGGSQFFITHSPQPHLDGRYTVFGHVVAGMEVVDQVRQGDVIRRVTIRDGVLEP